MLNLFILFWVLPSAVTFVLIMYLFYCDALDDKVSFVDHTLTDLLYMSAIVFASILYPVGVCVIYMIYVLPAIAKMRGGS